MSIAYIIYKDGREAFVEVSGEKAEFIHLSEYSFYEDMENEIFKRNLLPDRPFVTDDGVVYGGEFTKTCVARDLVKKSFKFVENFNGDLSVYREI